MTVPNGSENDTQGQEWLEYDTTGTQPVEDTGSGDSPDFNSDDYLKPYIEKFPESLHGVARDIFKEWDSGVTKRIQTIHDEYAPYKGVIDQYEPDAVAQALQLTESLEADPQAFANALIGAYGLEAQQAAQEVLAQQEPEPAPVLNLDPAEDPRLAQHEQMLAQLANLVLGERQQKEQEALYQQQEQWIDQTLADLKTKHGDFDEVYVLTLIGQGADPEAAVTQFQNQMSSWQQRNAAPGKQAPIVMGAGGGVPSGQVSASNLNGTQTQDLVAEMLRLAKENG